MTRTALVIVHRPTVSPSEPDPGSDTGTDTDTDTDTDTEPFHFADPASPQLSVQDLGVTRGDGIFETISVVGGAPHALEAHLARFARSAEVLDLPAPDLGAWWKAITAAATRIDRVSEAFVRAVLTRGIEGTGHPTGWAYAAPSPDYTRVREFGVRVALLDRGLRHNVQATSPWLLSGAKTLSYAVNRAALREAARRGADDVVFVSSEGFVLEGPTASLIYLSGERICTPATGLGILAGTTQGDIFEWAHSSGRHTAFEMVTTDQFRQVDAAWLVSSGRLAVAITALDGRALPVRADITAEINAFLLARTAGATHTVDRD
jgi:4-amino-4-deoxychorismate lyase